VSEMRVLLHREIPDSEDFRRQWNALVNAMERPEVFYTWEWARAVAHAYSAALRPLLFAGYRDEKLTGIAALANSEDVAGGVCFLASTTADYCDFISAPCDRKEWIELVMRELRAMGTADLKLANLPAVSASAAVLRAAAQKSGYSTFARPAYFCAQIVLQSQEEQVDIARSARRNAKRARRGLAAMGEVAIEHNATSEMCAAELPGLAAAHVARFLSLGRTSNLVGRERRVFLEELAKLLSGPGVPAPGVSAQGALALSTLKIGDRTVAWHYGFQYAGVWFWYLPVFDAELQHLKPGPGSCLFYEILLRAAEDPGIHTVDLGLGNEGYKARYAKSGRQTLYVAVSRSRVRLAREFCRHRAASLVARSPSLEARVRRSLVRIASVRARLAQQGILGNLAYYFSRVAKVFFDDAEVLFLDWAPTGFLQASVTQGESELRLQPLSINLLAAAAMEYEHDADTQEYLLRSAGRLQSAAEQGYALLTAAGIPVHFCWVAPFEGFRMQGLGEALKQPAAGAVLICDGWTPRSQLDHQHGARCAGMVADLTQASGKRPWIFSAAPDSTAELEREGFVPRFRESRKKVLFFGFSHTTQMELKTGRGPAMDLYPEA
jgi:CelD/BcsL family acetyltransferase involved in cellulose biosynthesis